MKVDSLPSLCPSLCRKAQAADTVLEITCNNHTGAVWVPPAWASALPAP
jgi:hypothetical protein